jgi:hypothetical protein
MRPRSRSTNGEPVDSIETRDVFVVEEIESAPTSRLAPSGSLV